MVLGNHEGISLRKAIGDAQLIQLELVLSKAKQESIFFEEDLWGVTREIKEATNGYEFRAYEIMHLIYLLVFKTTKVDESRVDKENVLNLIKMLDSVRVVLPHFTAPSLPSVIRFLISCEGVLYLH